MTRTLRKRAKVDYRQAPLVFEGEVDEDNNSGLSNNDEESFDEEAVEDSSEGSDEEFLVKPTRRSGRVRSEQQTPREGVRRSTRKKRNVRTIKSSGSDSDSAFVASHSDSDSDYSSSSADVKRNRKMKDVVELSATKILDEKEMSVSDWKSFLIDFDTSQMEEGSVLRNECPSYFSRVKSKISDESTVVKKLLIKWNKLSHLHCSWEEEEDLKSLCFATQGKTFWQNRFRKLEEEGPTDPAMFKKIHRILHKEEENGFSYYLVKWQNSSYDDCTYEVEEDLLKFSCDLKFLNKMEQEYSNRIRQKGVVPRKDADYTPDREFKGGNRLRSYQIESVNWLTYNLTNGKNSILADEMGLGKTLQAIAFMHRMVFSLKIKPPFLVIAPLSTLNNWLREFEAWTEFNCIIYHGSPEGREIIQEYEMKHNFDVVITSYDTAARDLRYLGRFNWNLLVVDEAHRLKNDQSKLTTALRTRLMIKQILLLTGTPIQNNLKELWTLLNFMNNKDFPSYQEFDENWGDMTTSEQMEEFQEMLRPYMLRRIKSDVEKLPEKVDILVDVEMTTLQKRFYRAIYEKNRKYLSSMSKKAFKSDKLQIRNGVSLKNISIQLRKCCNHPYLLKGVEQIVTVEKKEKRRELKQLLKSDEDFAKKYQSFCDGTMTEEEKAEAEKNGSLRDLDLLKNPLEVTLFEEFIRSSGKLILLDKLFPKLKQEGHRILLFSQWTMILNLLEDFCLGRGYSYERIDGSVKNTDRQLAIDRFNLISKAKKQKQGEAFVFLLSTKASREGINLTSADTVVLYDGDWNPQNDLQALARCHRIGQTKTVQIYRLLTSKSYEQTMFLTANKKLGLDLAITSKLEAMNPLLKSDSKQSVDKTAHDAETERLLKYGAYVLTEEDDSKADAFMKEDIEHILSKRAFEIKEQPTEGKLENGVSNPLAHNNKLSKAKFGVNDINTELDVSDPDFWKKIVGVEGFDEAQFQHENIVFNKRKRKQVNYNTTDAFKDKLNDLESQAGEDSEFELNSEEDESSSSSNESGAEKPEEQQTNGIQPENNEGSKTSKTEKSPKKASPKLVTNTLLPPQPMQLLQVPTFHNKYPPLVPRAVAMSGRLLYNPAFFQIYVIENPTLPSIFPHLSSFSFDGNSFIVQEDGRITVSPFQHENVMKALLKKWTEKEANRTDPPQMRLPFLKRFVSMNFMALLLEYVVAFSAPNSFQQQQILESLRVMGETEGIPMDDIQRAVENIIRASSLFLICIVQNWSRYRKVNADSKEAFEFQIPKSITKQKAINLLQRCGYIKITKLFENQKKKLEFLDPVENNWLITLSFDIVKSVERGLLQFPTKLQF